MSMDFSDAYRAALAVHDAAQVSMAAALAAYRAGGSDEAYHVAYAAKREADLIFDAAYATEIAGWTGEAA